MLAMLSLHHHVRGAVAAVSLAAISYTVGLLTKSEDVLAWHGAFPRESYGPRSVIGGAGVGRNGDPCAAATSAAGQRGQSPPFAALEADLTSFSPGGIRRPGMAGIESRNRPT